MAGRDPKSRGRGQPAPPVDLQQYAGRIPPHDLKAEAAVLSAILLFGNEALDRYISVLLPEHFYSRANGRIYEAALACAKTGRPIDIVTIAGELRDRDQLGEIHATYLAELSDAVPGNIPRHLDEYAKTVRTHFRVRTMISTCQGISAEGYCDIGVAEEWLDKAEQRVFEVASDTTESPAEGISTLGRTVINRLAAAAARGESLTGVSTGFQRYDSKTAGLHKGELTIIAARPGMGKTSLVLNMSVNVSKIATPAVEATEDREATPAVPGQGVAIFSLEMPKEQLASRLLCAESRVDVGALREGRLLDRDWQKLTTGMQFLDKRPIIIDDSPALSILDLRGKLRRLRGQMMSEYGAELALVVIDYLQLMSGHGDHESRENEISFISRQLKQIAKEMMVPVIALSQMNRAVDTRGTKEKRPQLSDLRESGAIEQDSDNVVFIYRDEYYKQEESELKGIAELIIAKQRNGPTGRHKVRWNAAYTRFDNLAPGEHDEWEQD